MTAVIGLGSIFRQTMRAAKNDDKRAKYVYMEDDPETGSLKK